MLFTSEGSWKLFGSSSAIDYVVLHTINYHMVWVVQGHSFSYILSVYPFTLQYLNVVDHAMSLKENMQYAAGHHLDKTG
jgi:hypothetical protein